MAVLWQRVKTWALDLKLAQKLSIMLTAVILLLLTIIFRIEWNLYSQDMENTTGALFMQVSYSFETIMDNSISNLNALSKAPLYSSEMQEDMKNDRVLSNESVEKMQYSRDVVGTTDSLHHVIALYSKSGRPLFSSALTNLSYVVKDYYDEWYAAAKEKNGAVCITGFPETEENFVCTLSRILKNISTFQEVGLISISVPRSVFIEACEQLEDIAGSVATVFGSQGEIIFSSESEADGEIALSLKTEAEADAGIGKNFSNGDYIGYYSRESNGKYAVLIYTTRTEIMQNQQRTRELMIIMLVLVSVCMILIITLLTRSVTKPLTKIAELMVKVQNGDWKVRFRPAYRDEIGVLGENFDRMLDRMNDMTEQLVDVSTRKKQTEIDALQGQINPHFMYNTLEAFRMMAVEKDDFELADLIASFGKMLRYNITTMNEMTTIRQEIEYLDHYIRIQNKRYPRQITLVNNVPDELMELHVIKLLIQPIVENAIFHGLEMKLAQTRKISITVTRRGELCNIDIRDNGLGMNRETLEQLRSNIKTRYSEAKDNRHVGMRNVNERIHLYYGEDYGLTVLSEENKGTLVRISLPYDKMKGEGENVEDSDS